MTENRFKSAFLSDVDGTLLRGNVPVPQGVVDAAKEYMAAGGGLGLCTGRAPVSAVKVARQIGANLPCVFLAGAALYDCAQERFVWTSPLPVETAQSIAVLYSKYPDISIQVATDKGAFVVRRNRRLNERGVAEENQGPLYAFEELEGQPLKVVLCCDEVEQLEACQKECFCPELYNFAFASRHFVDIVAKRAGKGKAMEALAERINLPLERFFAAGDGMTDLPMLLLAGKAYAPENAAEAVVKAAAMVVPRAEKEGMVQAFADAAQLTRGWPD